MMKRILERQRKITRCERKIKRVKKNETRFLIMFPATFLVCYFFAVFAICKFFNTAYSNADELIEPDIVPIAHLSEVVYISDQREISELHEYTRDFVITDRDALESGLFPEEVFKIAERESLDVSVQLYMKEKADEWDMPAEILLAIAKKESGYQYDAVSSTGDYGLMQINRGNFRFLRSKGISEWFDPYQSIDAACILLNEMRTRYRLNDWHQILMVYNMGYDRAKELWINGQYSSSYSRTVMEYASNFARG